jgi:hypothetical protein
LEDDGKGSKKVIEGEKSEREWNMVRKGAEEGGGGGGGSKSQILCGRV